MLLQGEAYSWGKGYGWLLSTVLARHAHHLPREDEVKAAAFKEHKRQLVVAISLHAVVVGPEFTDLHPRGPPQVRPRHMCPSPVLILLGASR